MGRAKFIIGMLALAGALAGVFFVLGSDKALITHPKGIIARHQLTLIQTNVLLMLVILVPTLITLLVVAFKGKSGNPKPFFSGLLGQLLLWAIPSVIVVVMAVITWNASHALDPYRPLQSDVKPLTIQVVALEWKWLFIYPEQGIATLNEFQFPEQTPIHLQLSADGSPMNSFWVPELSGQIYAMTGMVTSLHVMADGPGEYVGRASEINGDGYASMIFVARSTSQADFEAWVAEVKQSSVGLTEDVYNALVKPSINPPTTLYSHVETGFFDQVVMKYMHSPQRT